MKPPQKAKLYAELKRLREEFGVMVAQYASRNPLLTYEEIGAQIGIFKSDVSMYCTRYNVTRQRGNGSTAARIHKAND